MEHPFYARYELYKLAAVQIRGAVDEEFIHVIPTGDDEI